jgi:hypothetical protein
MPDQVLIALALESEESANVRTGTIRKILETIYPAHFCARTKVCLDDPECFESFRLAMVQRLCRVGFFLNGPVRLTTSVRVRKAGVWWNYNPSKQSPFATHYRELRMSDVAIKADS